MRAQRWFMLRLLTMASLAIVAAGCADTSSSGSLGDEYGIDDGAKEGASEAQVVAPGQSAQLVLPTGAALSLPAGAVAGSVQIALRRPPDSEVAALVQGIAPASVASAPYVITPHGTQFLQPVEIVLPVSPAAMGKSLVVAWRADERDPNWKVLGRAVVVGGRVSFTVEHLSVFVLRVDDGTLVVPAPADGGSAVPEDAGAADGDEAEDAGAAPTQDAAATEALPDGGGEADASAPADAGTTAPGDAGTVAVDGGPSTPADAGPGALVDAAAGAADSGTATPADASAGSLADAGSAPADAGSSSSDAGPLDAAVDAGVASSTHEILSFRIGEVAGELTGANVSLTVPFGTSLEALAPIIETNGVAVRPESGTPQDFREPVSYTVTAANGSTRAYTVRVSVAPSAAKTISGFTIGDAIGTITDGQITITVPFRADVTMLTPTITTTGTSIDPPSGAQRDFSKPLTYVVTAADGSKKDYLVTVTKALSDVKAIVQFHVAGVNGTITGNSITVVVPYGTDITKLGVGLGYQGASVAPIGNQDFSKPVVYTVTAADGSTATYTATVTVAKNTAKDITDFVLLGQKAQIKGTAISLTVPFGTDVSAVAPSMLTVTGESVEPIETTPLDFSKPQTYVVTAADRTTKAYTVTVTIAASSANRITAFSLMGVAASIGDSTINVTVPWGTDVDGIAPSTLTHDGVSISPALDAPQDFSSPVTYRVTAGNGDVRAYQVAVYVGVPQPREIFGLAVNFARGVIVGTDIYVTAPYGTDLENVPEKNSYVNYRGASIEPATMGTNFSQPVQYTVTALDGYKRTYTVHTSVAAADSAEVVYFGAYHYDGIIDGTHLTVHLPTFIDLPEEPPLNIAATTLRTSHQRPIKYSDRFNVVAGDGSQREYTFDVLRSLEDDAEITGIRIGNLPLVRPRDPFDRDLVLTVPSGTDVTALLPIVSFKGEFMMPEPTQVVDFTRPVDYVVQSASGRHAMYRVTVLVEE